VSAGDRWRRRRARVVISYAGRQRPWDKSRDRVGGRGDRVPPPERTGSASEGWPASSHRHGTACRPAPLPKPPPARRRDVQAGLGRRERHGRVSSRRICQAAASRSGPGGGYAAYRYGKELGAGGKALGRDTGQAPIISGRRFSGTLSVSAGKGTTRSVRAATPACAAAERASPRAARRSEHAGQAEDVAGRDDGEA